MSLTCHCVDNEWKLHKKIINFCIIDSHKGEAIGKIIERCLKELGIDRVFTITIDNAGSNNVAISYLKKRFSNLGTCILGGKYLHMRCVAHILNLIVTNGLKDSTDSIARVRGVVRYVRQSPARWSKFQEVAILENIESGSSLCLDICTRWNSTYLMLETAVKFQKAFDDVDPNFRAELMLTKDVDIVLGVPEKKDWDTCRIC